MKTLDVTYQIAAPADRVFAALTQKDLIEQWSGATAEMGLEAGSTFSLWEGDIHGINQEVSKDRIVQEWKVANWKAYSECIISWHDASEGGTELRLVHSEIPDEAYESIAEGWDEYYLGPLKALVEKMTD
ncbi:MAG TPA: ATPase [Cytophagales bacterium]|nr:ATPase [Cytophagales bacterium]HAA21836.1 ATPase [Cytophagales bacterium]HAP63833.1 ATPase [Cytophagales bacterium]